MKEYLKFCIFHSLAQSVKVLIALAVFCTYGLQFFVCLEICWDGVKDYYKGSLLANYVVRTVLVTTTGMHIFNRYKNLRVY